MNKNIIPTQQQIEIQAAQVFPENLELKSNFIISVYYGIYCNN